MPLRLARHLAKPVAYSTRLARHHAKPVAYSTNLAMT